jgi:transcriptional regulator with XRE-family HTH domain
MADRTMRPSEVFAGRLRETRQARGLSQAELARRLTDAGRPMSKAALLRIESGERGLSLDEALALAHGLNAVAAHLLSPPNGAFIALTDSFALDGSGLRDWLRYGLWSWEPAPDEGHREGERANLEATLARLAVALTDAVNGNDKAGMKDVSWAIVETVRQHPEALKRGDLGTDG